jgi:hypothetical protein
VNSWQALNLIPEKVLKNVLMVRWRQCIVSEEAYFKGAKINFSSLNNGLVWYPGQNKRIAPLFLPWLS